MKRTLSPIILFASISVLMFSFSTIAQIPNRGFENWSNDQFSNLSPNGWTTSNILFFVNIDRSTQSHSDSFAVHGFIGTSSSRFPSLPDLRSGFPINYRPLVFTGYFQYFPDGGDSLLVSIHLFRQKTVVGLGLLAIKETTPSYEQFHVPITYLTSEIPDSCFIEFGLYWGTFPPSGTLSTYYLIDDLDFSGVSIVSDNEKAIPKIHTLQQNYPNPFNPTTKIEFQITQRSFVRLSIVDLLGKQMKSLVSEEMDPGTYIRIFDGASFSSGIYFYRLQAGAFNDVKKMMLQK